MSKKIREILPYIGAFFIPFVLLFFALFILGVAPFGDETLVISDANAQYINYISYFRKVLQGQHSFFYSFSKNLGGNMIGLDAFYLMNPWLLLFAFASDKALPVFFGIVSILNASTAGLTMYILLSQLHDRRRSDLIFSTSYAMMGYFSTSGFHLMLLTGPWILPLVVLGIIRLTQGRSPLFYSIALAAALIMNFYTGYMICMASVFIFAGILIIRQKDSIKTAIRWAVASLAGGLASAVIWYPAVFSLKAGRIRRIADSDFSMSESFPFIQIFSKLFTGASSTDELISGHPSIFCGILVVALVVLFFINREISKKKRAVVGAILVIYLLSFYIVAFASAFHGFNATIWFPFRYSFVFSFLLIGVAAEEFGYVSRRSTGITEDQARRVFLGIAAAAVLIFSTSYGYIKGSFVLLDLALLFLMGVAYCLYRGLSKKLTYRVFVGMIFVLVCVNLTFNYVLSVKPLLGWSVKQSDFLSAMADRSVLFSNIKESDDGFYRMETEEQRTNDSGNDPMLFDYNGVGNSSSCERLFVNKGISKFGVAWMQFRNSYDRGIAPSMDAFLGIKYLVSKNDLAGDKDYVKIAESGDFKSYENPYALPVAILSQQSLGDLSLSDREDIFQIQNEVWKHITGGNRDIYTKAEGISYQSHGVYDSIYMTDDQLRELDEARASGDESAFYNTGSAYIGYEFVAMRDGPIYLFSSETMDNENGTSDDALQFLGTYHAGDLVSGRYYTNTENINRDTFENLIRGMQIYYADDMVLAEYADSFWERPCTIEKLSDTHLSGKATFSEGQELIFTIPYDSGWRLTVDGKETPLNLVMDVFMGVSLPAGTHTYELTFVPDGLYKGMAISVVGLIILVLQVVALNRLLSLSLRRKAPSPLKSGS